MFVTSVRYVCQGEVVCQGETEVCVPRGDAVSRHHFNTHVYVPRCSVVQA